MIVVHTIFITSHLILLAKVVCTLVFKLCAGGVVTWNISNVSVGLKHEIHAVVGVCAWECVHMCVCHGCHSGCLHRWVIR